MQHDLKEAHSTGSNAGLKVYLFMSDECLQSEKKTCHNLSPTIHSPEMPNIIAVDIHVHHFWMKKGEKSHTQLKCYLYDQFKLNNVFNIQISKEVHNSSFYLICTCSHKCTHTNKHTISHSRVSSTWVIEGSQPFLPESIINLHNIQSWQSLTTQYLTSIPPQWQNLTVKYRETRPITVTYSIIVFGFLDSQFHHPHHPSLACH